MVDDNDWRVIQDSGGSVPILLINLLYILFIFVVCIPNDPNGCGSKPMECPSVHTKIDGIYGCLSPQTWQFICLHPRILSLPSVLSSVFIDFTPTVSANKASMQQTFDPFAGVSKHFNLVPAMPLMEIFLAKECEVHRSRAKQRPTMGDLYSYMDLKTLKTAKQLIFL